MNYKMQFLRAMTYAGFFLAACAVWMVTGSVEASMTNGSIEAQNNPHQIPNELNPKFPRIYEKLEAMKTKAAGLMVESSETLHSLALSGQKIKDVPTYDYTTGTSN